MFSIIDTAKLEPNQSSVGNMCYVKLINLFV